ncbi:MAG: hypothetical protein VB934_08220 [Polyangiaceae bacterium]
MSETNAGWIDRNSGYPTPRFRRLLIAGPLFFVLFCVALRATHRPAFFRLIAENGPVESATALSYLALCGVSAMAARGWRKQEQCLDSTLYKVLALAAFFVAGEELSWGQHLIGFQPPTFFVDHNLQGETTAHNLIHGRYIHGLYATLAASAVFARHLQPRRVRDWLGRRRDEYFPPLYLSTFFLPAMVYFSIPLDVIFRHAYITWRWQEPFELLLGLGLLSFVAINLHHHRLAAPSHRSKAAP